MTNFWLYQQRKTMLLCWLLWTTLVFFGGCDTSNQNNSNTIKLTIWECFKYEEHDQFVKLIKEFTQEYKKKTGKTVVIDAQRVPYDDFETNIKLAALGHRTPDIACFDALKVLSFAYHKILVPLDTLENFDAPSIAAKRKFYMKGAFDTNVVEIKGEKHLYGLPLQTTCLALFYNKSMFAEKAKELKQAGLDPQKAPKTWTELVKYGKILSNPQKKQYGFAMQNKLWFTMPFFGGFNVSYLKNIEGKLICNFASPEACAALQIKVDLYQKYKIEAGAWIPGAIKPDIGFENSKYAMILMGPWNIQKYRKAKLNFGIALIPRVSKKKAKEVGLIAANASDQEYLQKVLPATNVGGQNIAIFKSCRYRQIAYEFINFVTGKEGQLRWSKNLNQIPVHVEAAKILRQDPHTNKDIKIFMQQALYSTAPPSMPRYGYLENDIINPEMELALKNQKTVQQALQDASRKINEKILAPLNKR